MSFLALSEMRRTLVALIATIAIMFVACPRAIGQTSGEASVSGVVTAQGTVVSGAAITLKGVVTQSATTDAKGHYQFLSVPPGFYQLIVTKPGFIQVVFDVAVASTETVTANVVLSQQSFQSLTTIARVSTGAAGYAQINEGVSSINTISSETFQQQAQTQVMNVLNETPGIIAWGEPSNQNGADEDTPQVIQIRGALPYETETLIDGHATPLGTNSGFFDPSILNPAMLQSVEIVKGPGSEPAEINYAIGGTVNFITLQPTLTPQAILSEQFDNYGGVAITIRATGSTPTHVLQYAFVYATNGAPGPLQNYPEPGSALFLTIGSNGAVNGQPIASSISPSVPAPEKSYNQYDSYPGQIRLAEPFYVCCYDFNTSFDSKNELAKVRINFSQASSLTLSYLGGQDFGNGDNVGVAATYGPVGALNSSWSYFAPPVGYSGSVPAGTQMPFNLSSFENVFSSVQQYLYQAEFRTTLGQWSAFARYYSGGNNYAYGQPETASGFYAFSGNTWGGALLCPSGTTYNGTVCNPGATSPTMTFFNGAPATFTATNDHYYQFFNNHELGESIEFDRPFDNGSNLALSFDSHSQSGTQFFHGEGYQYDPLPPGASQLFNTGSVRYDMLLGRNVQVNVADYVIEYESHYTDNGGGILPGSGPASWATATRGYNVPRFGFAYHPNANTSWRFAVGSSIAPPYLVLLSSAGSTPFENVPGQPVEGFTEDLNNGGIAPETSFGYDVGADWRLKRSVFVSFDAYLTNLRNMYLPSTFLVNQDYVPPTGPSVGTCPAVGDCPLYASATENLGHARYDGVEATIGDAPASGLGFRLQGDLTRAYAYDLPPGFYCTNVPAGKCTPFNYNTNLGILPGTNFVQSGAGFNAINGASVPYSMGYGEINYRTLSGAFARIGATYFGPNNADSVPAFFVLSAGVSVPIGHHLVVQLSANNLTGANSKDWADYFGGVPVPLAPECVGKYGGPAAGATGVGCTDLVNTGAVPRSAVSVVPQEGITTSGNIGPTTVQLQLIEKLP